MLPSKLVKRNSTVTNQMTGLHKGSKVLDNFPSWVIRSNLVDRPKPDLDNSFEVFF